MDYIGRVVRASAFEAESVAMLADMSKKKQRDREERYRRHGVERPRSPQIDEKESRDEIAADSKAKSSKGRRASAPRRGRKPVAYPTLFRCLVRAPLFGLMWFVIARFFLDESGNTVNADILQAVILSGAMVPLLFMADTVTYRLARRRNLEVAERPADGWIGFPGKR